MLRATAVTLVAFAMLAVNSANAQPAETSGKPAQSRAVQGVLTGQNGEQVKFSIPEGGGIKVKDKEGNATYRLVPDKLNRDQAELKVIDTATNQGIDRFELGFDGKAQSGTVVPFSLALTGVTTRSTVNGAGRCGQKSASGDDITIASCCVECGAWIVCCEPGRGWCCDLECVGGDSCSACSAS